MSTPLWQKFGQRANMPTLAYYNGSGEDKPPRNFPTTWRLCEHKKGTSKWENSFLVSGSISPYNVMSVMQAHQEERFGMKCIESACTPSQRKGSSPQLRKGYTCLHARGGKGMWRRLLWLYKSCTKCQECSSLFARASQIPIQDWQLGLFGENDVG